MTIEERNNKLKHFITCLKCGVSGKSCNVNCSTQYDAGNMGEIIENLEAISLTLDKQKSKITALQNRCYALTKGIMCIFCMQECKYKAEREE